MSSNPRFSILIPAFKSEYLNEAIESCLAQDFPDFEIIIVNDASPYHVEDIVRAYHDQSGRIHYFENEENIGAVNVVDNWNKALSLSNGQFVICIGDDDMLKPHCLSAYNRLIEKYPNVKLFHAWTEIINESSTVVDIQSPRPEYESAYSLIWNRWQGRAQFIGDFCFEKDNLLKNGGFYKLPMAWGSDDISAVIAASVNGVVNTQEICFQYRVNESSISKSGNYIIKNQATLLEKAWYYKFLERASDIDLSYEDTIFLMLLKCEYNHHFKAKFSEAIHYDLLADRSSIKYWKKNYRQYGISSREFSKIVISSFKSFLLGKYNKP